MALTRIKTNNILDRQVFSNDLADGAVTFDKILLVDVGNPGDVLTVDGAGNLLFAPANGTATTLGALADVNVAGVTNDQVLAYNAGTSEWRPITIAGVGATSNTYVVDDIPARDLLTPATGDSCFVRTGSSGEYEQYIYDGAWILIATADSARTDANTMEAIVFFNSSTPVLVGNVSNNTDNSGQGTRITNITVEVVTPFDGLIANLPVPTAPAFFTVGDSVDNARLLDDVVDGIVDWTTEGSYTCSLDIIYDGTDPVGQTDVDIFAYFDFTNSTVGEARVIVTHV